jgi:dienelactone hydrolase
MGFAEKEVLMLTRRLIVRLPLFAFVTLVAGSRLLSAQAAPTRPAPTPEQLAIQATTEKDHQRVMDMLGIKQLRPGASGNANGPNPANYDESKADVYRNLPDPLVMKDGEKVTTPEMWWTKRRPEIAEDVDREILGRTPASTPKVTWEVVSTTREMNGKFPVITKKLLGHVDNSSYPAIKVDIDLTLSTPANATRPVPVMMEFGLSREFLAMMAKINPQFAASMAAGGPGQDLPWQQQVLAMGWGYAELIPTSYQADNGAGLTQGIIGLVNKGQPRKLDDWGVLKAWAWGASRAIDYFETDKDVDAKQIGLEGHSRYGKATLVTMAYDPRLAIAYVSSSGEGGAKLYRHNFGEQEGNIAGAVSYHWVAGNFLKYAGPLTPGDMPVDAHDLIAMCAPRPVFISAGATQGDGWVDAKGQFLAAAGAGPVYRLLGKKDMGTTEFPPIETALIKGDIGYRQHSGGHTPGPNWPTFLIFASRYIHSAPAAPTQEQLAIAAAAVKDHQQMLDALGIKQLRPAASHDPKSPNAVNYDESKANPYKKLPDPLKLNNGKAVTSADMWWKKRRPEIVSDFDKDVLGRVPANAPKVTWEVVNTRQESVGGVPAVIKRVNGRVDNSSYPAIKVTMDMIVTTPAHASGPVPLIMELAFSPEFNASIVRGLPEMLPGGPGNQGPRWQEQVVARGWGYAILLPTSFQADDGAGLTSGVIGLVNKGKPRSPDDWGSIRAWAWGASRALDYLETDKAVDAKQVGIMGHSRFGKTALVAMAYDPRFAVAYISSAGTGGDKLYRHVYGEQLENLAAAPTFYYWMAGNFIRYAGPLTTDDLPVDAHELIALCAPRPVFIGVGSNTAGDQWADPMGEFLGAVGAGPVYRLLGKKDLGTKEFPAMETGLLDGDLAYRQHHFGHTPEPNWPYFLDFAARYLHGPAAK